MVQLAAHIVNLDSEEITQTMDVIIKPEGWKSSPEAFEAHGITEEYAFDVGVREKTAVEMFLDMWRGRKRVAFNTTFDNRIISIATKRYCSGAVQEAWHVGEYECAMIAARKAMAAAKNPTLGAAYQHFMGIELKEAHRAIVDTNACLAIYLAIKSEERKAA